MLIARLVWLIPLAAAVSIGWINLQPLGGRITHVIDVGGVETLLGPSERVSARSRENGATYREIRRSGVYFELHDRRLKIVDTIKATVKFKPTVPPGERFLLGARNQQPWSYQLHDVYKPLVYELAKLPLVTGGQGIQVFAAGRRPYQNYPDVASFLSNPPVGSAIATNIAGLGIDRSAVTDLGLANLRARPSRENHPAPDAPFIDPGGHVSTSLSLRGRHTFFTFVATDLLILNVMKRDINAYTGEDLMVVRVYGPGGSLVHDITFPDDRDTTKSRRISEQFGRIVIDGAEQGTYRIEIRPVGDGGDALLGGIEVNQGRIVAKDEVFIAGRAYLGGALTPEVVWVYLAEEGQLYFETGGTPQRVTITADDGEETVVEVDSAKRAYESGRLQTGRYRIVVEKGNMVARGLNAYFGFTSDSLFVPSTSSSHKSQEGLVVNTALRGPHTFQVLVEDGNLEVQITKKDLNGYAGEDNMTVEVFSSLDTLIGSLSIPDDGDVGTQNERGPSQVASLRITGLDPGSYRIVVSANDDQIIRRIVVNQDFLVVSGQVFLIGEAGYRHEGLLVDPVTLYGITFEPTTVSFRTVHDQGLQKVTMGFKGEVVDTSLEVRGKLYTVSGVIGDYWLESRYQDLIIESASWWSFTPDSFFLPERVSVQNMSFDSGPILEEVDFLVLTDWLISSLSWEMGDLYAEKSSLSFVFLADYLDRPGGSALGIPLDWIEIEVHVPPLWERFNIGD